MADLEKAFSLHSEGKLDEAKKIYFEFLAENPEQPDVSNCVGLIYLQNKEFEEAEKYFKFAVKGFPCAEYYQNLGLAYYNKNVYAKAMECFSKAIEFESKNVDFIRNFAQLAKTAEQYGAAAEFYKKSLEVEPKDFVGLNNLGLIYEKLKDNKSAKECYIKSLKIKKNYEASYNLGVLYRAERNFQASIQPLKDALKFKPEDDQTNVSLGMSYLVQKDFKIGFEYYGKNKRELRKEYKNHWNGDKHPNKTLLVYYTAGYGDIIMFARYLPLLKDYFEKVKVLISYNLKTLLSANYPDFEFITENDNLYDFNCDIMELPYLLDIDFEHIPPAPYLKANGEKFKEFFNTEKKKIGLFWQGSKVVLKNRAINLSKFEKIIGMKNIQLYSFQIEDFSEIKNYPQIIDLGKDLGSFADTADALMNLDVLITIDSSIAHLAGALGVKTYLLLPFSSEWRWFDDTKTTPWYKSVEIFKQSRDYNWEPVFKEIYKEIYSKTS